ncbi:azurin [Cognatiluteimonas profundi]|uniref:azurin n=1 Tax=Cognatiluteimonas profundi TaxID=2594501 RepID=UPI00131EA005|nr:azurin [Lysobacter profundi]
MRTLLFLAVFLASGFVHAESCTIDLKSNDAMRFDQHSATVSSTCKTITVNFSHTGKLPAQAMGHNLVIASAADYQAVAQDGLKAGLANNYVKPGDTRVIASTKIIGGGESTSTTFPGSKLKAGGAYKLFCTAPGHLGMMTDQLIVK